MALTFGEVKSLVAPYAGRGGGCSDSQATTLFARQVLEHVLFSGQHGSVRQFCFVTYKGLFTAPPELETPLKIRIDNEVSTVWSKWYSFYMHGEIEGAESCAKFLIEQPNPTPLIYPVPPGGSLVGVLGTCSESDDAYVIVKGEDLTGREIITMASDGSQIRGERFRIKKGELRYGKVLFGKVTEVVKSKTNGYVQLWSVNPNNQEHQLLADYSPLEEKPSYRQYKVRTIKGPYVHISILGRVRLKENYTDNDLVPFDSLIPITIAAQRLQAETNNDVQTAAAKDKTLNTFIMNEGGYKKATAGSVIEVFHPLSGGAIKGIVR